MLSEKRKFDSFTSLYRGIWVVSALVVLTKFWGESILPILVGRFGSESFRPWDVSAHVRGHSMNKCFIFMLKSSVIKNAKHWSWSKLLDQKWCRILFPIIPYLAILTCIELMHL